MFWLAPHARFRRQLSAFMDGQLSEVGRQKLQAHLEGCPACRRQLEELRAMAAALKALPWEEAPRSFALRPEQAVRRPRPSAVGGLALPMRLAGAALATALALLLVVDLADLGGNGQMAPPAAVPVEEALEAAAPAPTPAPPAAQEYRGEPVPSPAEMPPEGAKELVPGAEGGGGIDPLRAAQIALAAALGILVLASAALSLRPRR